MALLPRHREWLSRRGHVYLAHTSAPIDEEVWFSQEDVASGRDTVVAATLAWIREAASE